MGKYKELLESSETGNWNVAAGYVRLLMQHLIELHENEKIAYFGTISLPDEFMLDDNTKNIARIKALRRYAKTLEMLIRDVKFALRKNDRPSIDKFKEEIVRVQKLIPMVEIKVTNSRERKETITIDEQKFDKFLSILINIKEQILSPMNRADLIFVGSDADWDPIEYKKQIMHRLSTQG